MLSSIKGRLPSKVSFFPRAAPELLPKWIKQLWAWSFRQNKLPQTSPSIHPSIHRHLTSNVEVCPGLNNMLWVKLSQRHISMHHFSLGHKKNFVEEKNLVKEIFCSKKDFFQHSSSLFFLLLKRNISGKWYSTQQKIHINIWFRWIRNYIYAPPC